MYHKSKRISGEPAAGVITAEKFTKSLLISIPIYLYEIVQERQYELLSPGADLAVSNDNLIELLIPDAVMRTVVRYTGTATAVLPASSVYLSSFLAGSGMGSKTCGSSSGLRTGTLSPCACAS